MLGAEDRRAADGHRLDVQDLHPEGMAREKVGRSARGKRRVEPERGGLRSRSPWPPAGIPRSAPRSSRARPRAAQPRGRVRRRGPARRGEGRANMAAKVPWDSAPRTRSSCRTDVRARRSERARTEVPRGGGGDWSVQPPNGGASLGTPTRAAKRLRDELRRPSTPKSAIAGRLPVSALGTRRQRRAAGASPSCYTSAAAEGGPS